MRFVKIIWLALLFVGYSAWAQINTRSINLNEAVALSLANDPDLQSALATRDAGVQAKWLAIAQVLPNITFTYQNNPNAKTESSNANTRGIWTTTHYDAVSKNITLRQPLVRPRQFIGVKQGFKQEEQALHTYNNALTQAVIRSLGAYGSYLIDESTFKLSEKAVNAAQLRELAFEKMNQAGLISTVDLLRSRHEKQRSLMEQSSAKQQLAFSKETFLKITGATNIRPSYLNQTPEPETLNLAGEFEDLLNKVHNSNHEIKAAEKAVEVARMEFLKNVADHSPSVDLVAQYTQSNSVSELAIGNQFKTTLAGVLVTVPIFTGGQVVAATRQADANYRKAMADLQSVKNRANANFYKAYEALNTAKERWHMASAAMRANQTDLESIRKQFKSGLKSKLDLSMAERNLAESERDETQAKVEWILAKANIMGLMGEIDKIIGQEFNTLFSTKF